MGDCILGTPPCTGLVTDRVCRRDLPVSETMQNINLTDLDFTATQVILPWTGGVGLVNFILKTVNDTSGVNDATHVPYTDGTVTLGNNLVVPYRFTVFYRCEDGGFCSTWKTLDFEFLGDVIPLFVDNGDYIVDGALPFYIADGG